MLGKGQKTSTQRLLYKVRDYIMKYAKPSESSGRVSVGKGTEVRWEPTL